MRSDATRRNTAMAAAAVVGVDSGKFVHGLVVRPQGAPDSKPLIFDVNREGFERAVAYIHEQTGGAQPSEVLVGIEFGGLCGYTFAHHLYELGFRIVTVRPRDTKRYQDTVHRRRNKTDGKDAKVIADLTWQGKFMNFPFAHPRYAAMRSATSLIDRITKQRTAAVNRLRAMLHVSFPEFEKLLGKSKFGSSPTPTRILQAFPGPQAILSASRDELLAVVREASSGKRGEAFVDQLITAAQNTLALPPSITPAAKEITLLSEQITFFNKQREALEESIISSLEAFPEAEYLMTIPSVGPLTTAMFLGSVGDVRSYNSVNEVLAMAGMGLRERASGTRFGVPRLSKEGRSVMRRYIYLLAVRQLATKGSPFAPRYAQMTSKGKHPKAAMVAIARKLLALMYAIARQREPFRHMEPPVTMS